MSLLKVSFVAEHSALYLFILEIMHGYYGLCFVQVSSQATCVKRETHASFHISGLQDFCLMLSCLDLPSSRCTRLNGVTLSRRGDPSHEKGLCFVLVFYMPEAVPHVSSNIFSFREADPSSLGSAMWTSLSFYFPRNESLHDPPVVKFLFALTVVLRDAPPCPTHFSPMF